MSTKVHLGFGGAYPFGQPSDNLQTTFGHFLASSKRYLGGPHIELVDASPTCKKLASHMLDKELIYLMLKSTCSCSDPIGHFDLQYLCSEHCGVGSCRKL